MHENEIAAATAESSPAHTPAVVASAAMPVPLTNGDVAHPPPATSWAHYAHRHNGSHFLTLYQNINQTLLQQNYVQHQESNMNHTSNNCDTNHYDHNSSDNEDESVQHNSDLVRKKLLEGGHMSRLKNLVDWRLKEVGWNLDTMQMCRNTLKKKGTNISYDTLLQSLRESAKASIPESLKSELKEKIKLCYESSVE